MRKSRVTGHDVAKAAGVSHNTVSLVVRDSPLVTPETKARVRAIIEEMGYQRNDVAMVLRSARSRTIGYLLPEDSAEAEVDVFRNQVLKAVTICAEAHNYYVLLDLFSDAQNAISLMSSGRIDALLVDGRIPNESLLKLAARNLPLVLVGRDAGDLPISWVKADEEGGAFQATSHLIELGHQRIAWIAAGEDKHFIVSQREQGYRRAMEVAGLQIEAASIVRGDWTFESGFALGYQVLTSLPRPTALFVVNELMAAAVLQAAHILGLRVPEDVSIVTIGDSFWSQYVQPALTTVQVPMKAVGTRATELLFQSIDEDLLSPQQIVLPTTLVVRDSSKRVENQ